ncbi:MAG TPA: ABC transporter permease [Gemmatimonadaceae bacterium]|nr:ABC transporter permease [Gemmatimonadaceae bacterium]
MPFGRSFRRLVTPPSRSDREIARDVAEEVAFHLEMRTSELRRLGHPPAEAAARARAEFGDETRARRALAAEDLAAEREHRRGRWWEDLRLDVRFAARQLRRAPAFAVVAVLTLALGIGATTAIMSAVRGILLQPLPLRDPDALVRLYSSSPRTSRTALSVADFTDYARETRSFAGLASFYQTTTNLSGQGDPERLQLARVDANWFDLLGVPPLHGRTFRPGEDAEGAPGVAVLAEGFWHRRFGAEPGIVGRRIILDGEAVEVIGVVSDANAFPAGRDLWTTTRYTAGERTDAQRGARWIQAVARLRPEVSLPRANAELAAVARRLEERDPRHNTGFGTRAVPLQESIVGEFERPLLVLLGAVVLVALIACANVAGLLLARTAARETEVAVRVALGAGRGRIVRQLMTESLLLSLAGAVGAFVLALIGTRLLVHFAPAQIPRLDGVRLDGAMFAFTLLLATVTGLAFGLMPALQTASRELQPRLRDGARGAAGHLRGVRLRRLLVVSELALSIMLLAGAGLLLRSFAALRAVDPGFRPEGLSAFTVVIPETKYATLESQRRFTRDALDRLRAIPGVDAAGASFGLPLTGTRFSLTFTIDRREAASAADEPTGQVRVASTDYFRTMGIPVIRGRVFTAEDTYEAPPRVVVSEALVRRYFPNEDPVGKYIETGWGREGRRLGGTIVGIVGDVKQLGLAADAPPAFYAAADQWPTDEITFIVRAATPHEGLVPAFRELVRELDADVPIFDVRTGAQLVAGILAPPRFYLLLLGGFAAVALALGAVGIYGIIAYTVRQRTREIGVRMALGASSGRIVRMVVGEGLLMAAMGIAIGLLGAFALSGALRDLLFNVGARDGATFAAVSLLLALVAIAACAVPARMAARVSPQRALRGD